MLHVSLVYWPLKVNKSLKASAISTFLPSHHCWSVTRCRQTQDQPTTGNSSLQKAPPPIHHINTTVLFWLQPPSAPADKEPRFCLALAITNFTGLFSVISILHHGTQEAAQLVAPQLLTKDSFGLVEALGSSMNKLGEAWSEGEEARGEAVGQPSSCRSTQGQAASEAVARSAAGVSLLHTRSLTDKPHVVNPSLPVPSHSPKAMQILTAYPSTVWLHLQQMFCFAVPFLTSAMLHLFNHRAYSFLPRFPPTSLEKHRLVLQLPYTPCLFREVPVLLVWAPSTQY